MLDIDIKDNGLLQALADMGRDVGPAAENALDVVAQRAKSAKAKEIAKTYARPIPRNGKGNSKWKRSGDFQRDQVILRDPFQRTIAALGNSEAYEERLAKLRTGADGVNRSNPASERAYDTIEPQIEAIFEQELLGALGF